MPVGVMLILAIGSNSPVRWNKCVVAKAREHKMASLPVKTTKSPHLHPSLKRRVGDAAEAALLVGAFAVIWGSIGVVVIAAIFG